MNRERQGAIGGAEKRLHWINLEILRELTGPVFSGSVGLIFSGIPLFGTLYPFGIAWLAAVSTWRWAAAACLGCLLGSLGQAYALAYASVYLILFIGRYLIGRYLADGDATPNERGRGTMGQTLWQRAIAFLFAERKGKDHSGAVPLFGEGLAVRVMLSLGGALSCGVFTVLLGASPAKDFLKALLIGILCPAVTAALCGVTVKHLRVTGQRSLGEAVLLGIAVFGLGRVEWMGLNLGSLLGALIAFGVSHRLGTAKGTLAGLLCGMMLEPLYAPVYAVAAALSGLLWSISPLIAAGAGCLSGVSWAVWVGGFSGMRTLLPELLLSASAVGSLVVSGYLKRKEIAGEAVAESKEDRALLEEAKRRAITENFEVLSETLRHAGDIFEGISKKRRRPSAPEIKALCDGVFDRYCKRCGYGEICWQKEYAKVAEVVSRMTATLGKEGRVNAKVIPEHLAARCYHMNRILDEINDAMMRHSAMAARTDKAGVFADDYRSMASLMSETVRRQEESLRYNEEASHRLRVGLRNVDFSALAVSVYGMRKRWISARGLDMSHMQMGGDDLRAIAEKMLDGPFSPPEFSLDRGGVSMTMRSLPRMGAVSGRCSSPATQGSANGDAVNCFESREGYYYALISDGMGTGREAALASRVSAVFLERMLSAGVSMKTALEMLHQFLRSGSSECSATVDLMELDLYTGEAKFVKSGAAPSFVLRGGKLFRLQSKTAPIGILRALDAEMMRFSLCPGDIVVMISDGVSQSFEEAVWLMDMLCREEEWEEDLSKMAEKIVRRAKEVSERPDDVTVGLVKVI